VTIHAEEATKHKTRLKQAVTINEISKDKKFAAQITVQRNMQQDIKFHGNAMFVT